MIKLSQGAGGKEMQELVSSIRKKLSLNGDWLGLDDDSAYIKTSDGYIVFTTDSFIVDPVFFKGGDIGKISVCGTINDLAVMGAMPLGLSVSFVLEEGFPKEDFEKIIDSIAKVSNETGIPIVAGDTKVTEKIIAGDKIVLSGPLGNHAVALLSERYNFESDVETDSKPLGGEMLAVKDFVKQARDPTRGGLSALLNELSARNEIGFELDEEKIPVEKGVKSSVEFLGLDLLELACEGRVVCFCSAGNAEKVLGELRKFNLKAEIIGECVAGSEVVLKTRFGKRIVPVPTGNIVPRIC